MASINKLSIRGVRAFSPDDQEQVVEFYFPLTIITGANGCGKTTIIESLKFALSGSMPPVGSARSAGQSFVHDPRIAGQSSVKANIKLRFCNKAGSSMVVIRSMEVTQKKSTMSFKQLDGVIRTIDAETGERVTLSHKCGELDKQIPSLLGVSKAILDYVLFVHQEDSSWPLQEAAVLKKRFDDIFDSTRYTKALDSFRKTKKELASRVKDIKADVQEFSAHKHAAKGFRKEKEKQNRVLEELDEEIESHERTVRQSQKDLEKYGEILDAVAEVQRKLSSKRVEHKQLRSVTDKQRSLLERDLTKEQSQQQLEEKLRFFDKEMKNEVSSLLELQREQQKLEADIDALRKQENKLSSSKGMVAAQKEAQNKRLKDRWAMMEKIAHTYSLDLQQSMTQLSARLDSSFNQSQGTAATEPAPELAEEDLRSFFKTLKEKDEELKEGLKNHKAKYREQEEEFNSALQELVGNRNAFENERTKLSKENKDIDEELKGLSKTLAGKRMKKSVLEDFREQRNQSAKELEKLTKNDARENLGAEIRGCTERIETIKDEIDDKQRVKHRLKNSAGLQAKIEMMKEACSSDAKNLHESIEGKLDRLKSFEAEVPADLPDDPTIVTSVAQIVDSVDTVYQNAKHKAAKATEKLEKARQSQAQQSAALGSLKQTLIGLQKRRDVIKHQSVDKVQRNVSEMNDVGFGIDWNIEEHEPQVLLEALDKTLQDLEDDSPEAVPPKVLTKVLKKIKALGKNADECPCCRRGLSGNEVKDFSRAIKLLGDKTNSPFLVVDSSEMQNYNANKAKAEGWRSSVYSSMNDLSEYRRILSEIGDKQPKSEHAEGMLKALNADVEKLESEASEAKRNEGNLRDLQEISKRWREQAARIEEQCTNIEDKRDTLQCETAGTVGELTLDQVEEALQTLQDEQGALYDKISKRNKKVSQFNTDLSAAQTRAANLAELCAKKEEKFQEEQKASERKQFLEDRRSTVSKEISKLGEQIASLQQKVKAKEAEKGRLYSHASDEENKLNETLNLFVSDSNHVQDMNKKIREFESSDKTDDLERIAAEVAKVVGKIKDKRISANATKAKLERASKVVDDQERQRKLLHDNIDLHSSEAQLADIQKKIQVLETDEASVEGADTAQPLYFEAEEKIRQSKHKASLLQGRRNEISEQIRGLLRKLAAPEYKNVDKEYKEASIKLETTSMAASDIEKYAQALDKALLCFHSIKIAEINKIIKELWLKCYKGEDIQNIELDSTADSRAAKSYNYRVVMSKGGTKMDMRGRCSAGQRVLASLVVRLALAETFGVDCGCLVLDEPTVNLDETNKRSLAVAMAQIIQTRCTQSNFQLVLITHDEEFVTTFKDELSTHTGFSMPEKYFRVQREEASDGKWYSKIDAFSFDEIL